MTPTGFKKALTQLAREMRARLAAAASEQAPWPADPVAQDKRVAQAQHSLDYFAQTYFPHYLQHPPGLMHQWLYHHLPALLTSPRGERLALAAPRGEAKSTLVGLIFVLWCVLTGRKRFVLLVMDSREQAVMHLESLKIELEANPRLAQDFPHATGRGMGAMGRSPGYSGQGPGSSERSSGYSGRGPAWRTGLAITNNGARIQAAGSHQRLRGLRHGPHRPDLVVADDLENDQNVLNPELRDKLHQWLNSAVMKLGPAGGKMDLVVVGTVLHHDSLLARLLADPTWEHAVFKGLVRWPDRMDLWDAWAETLRNQGREAALALYQAQAPLMEAGARVSWAAARPLLDLMEERARDPDAFDREIQNQPGAGEDAPFGRLHYWVAQNPRWRFFAMCDPSLGGAGGKQPFERKASGGSSSGGSSSRGRGDPSALLVAGYDPDAPVPTLDVVAADIRRRLPEQIMEDILTLQARFACVAWWVESVAFQAFFRTELVKVSAQRGIPVPALPFLPGANKALRIQAIGPHVRNGLIRLHPDQHTLIQQLTQWPHAAHDDGPDALAALWQQVTLHGRPLEVKTVPRTAHPRHPGFF